MAKFTNKSDKAVFVPNPDYNPDAPAGSPLSVLQKTRKLLPGESIDDCDSKVAKALSLESLKDRAGKHIQPRKGAKAITRDSE